MIKLKSSNNVQTFYIAKGCSDVCISDNTLPMGSYTKAEADERFQPKGDYPTLEDVNIIKEDLENNIDELSNTLSSEIAELEVSKQETFQVNQPLYFERSDEDLTLNVNLENYATVDDLAYKQDSLVSGTTIKTINGESILGSGDILISIPTLKYNASTNKFEGDFQAVYSAITSEDTPFSIYLPHNNEVIEATLAFVNGNNITAYASITYTGNSMHFAYYIKPDGTYTNAVSQFQAQEELTPGDNIDIDDDLVISWVAPDIQFVNTIFTDDEMLKYAIADFKGGYTEKEFPLATTSSAGLMSPEDKAKLDAETPSESIPYLYIIPSGYQYKLGDGDYTAVKNAVINDKPCLIYWANNTTSGTTAQFGDFVSLFETAEWVNNTLQIRFHLEEGNVHIHQLFNISDDGSIAPARQIHTYVNQSDYDTKIGEIDTAISDLQAQIGDIATVLDNIQGEVI